MKTNIKNLSRDEIALSLFEGKPGVLGSLRNVLLRLMEDENEKNRVQKVAFYCVPLKRAWPGRSISDSLGDIRLGIQIEELLERNKFVFGRRKKDGKLDTASGSRIEQLETKCSTPGMRLHFRWNTCNNGRPFEMRISVPESVNIVRLDPSTMDDIEQEIHDVLEKRLAPLFREQRR